MTTRAPWQLPPASLGLGERDVHVWRVGLQAEPDTIEDGLGLLSAGERDKAARFHFEEHRGHYVVTHAALRIILGRYLDADPAQLRFQAGADSPSPPALNQASSSLRTMCTRARSSNEASSASSARRWGDDSHARM